MSHSFHPRRQQQICEQCGRVITIREEKIGCFGCMTFGIFAATMLVLLILLFPYVEGLFLYIRGVLSEEPPETEVFHRDHYRLFVWTVLAGLVCGIFIRLARRL